MPRDRGGLSARSDHRRRGIVDPSRGENAPFLDRILAELRGVGIETCGKEACAWIDRASQKVYVPRFWTLDPIDGTKGFLRKEQYAISLALVIDGKDSGGLAGLSEFGV